MATESSTKKNVPLFVNHSVADAAVAVPVKEMEKVVVDEEAIVLVMAKVVPNVLGVLNNLTEADHCLRAMKT
jgi:hypothetical protein